MNVWADVIIALIGVSIIALYTYKGLVRVVLDTFKILLAFLISRLIIPNLTIDDPTVSPMICVVIFLVVFILLSVLFSIVDKIIKRIPIVRSLNCILGFVLGVGLVYLTFSIATVIFQVVAAYAPESVIATAEATLTAESKIYFFFVKNGLFSLLG